MGRGDARPVPRGVDGMIVHKYGCEIDPKELAEMVIKVTSKTGLVREEAFKVAIIAIEYQKPDRGKWSNNT